jgi:hypothetical protein
MPPFTIVVGLFTLSLVSAVVLFKFLKSTALVKNESYQAGGAIAGFIIVYGMLHWSYSQTAGYTGKIASLTSQVQALQQSTRAMTVTGTVTPSAGDTQVLIAAWEAPTDMSGAFSVKARCLEGSDQAKLVIVQQGHYYMKYITPGDPKIDVQLPH